MNRNRRILVCVIFSIIALVGAGLIFVSRLDPVVESYNSQNTVCDFEYSIQLNPSQTKTNDCVVLQNDWVELSVESNQNISLSIALTKVGGGQVLLFNNTNTNLNASFPISSNGALVANLFNSASNVSEVNGSLTVSTAILANTTALDVAHPYRTIGEGLVGLGGLVIFVAVWNPSLGAPSPVALPRRESLPT
jgi:hypothetical protein